MKDRKQDELETVSINATAPILKTLDYAKEPIHYNNLINQLQDEYPQANKQQFEGMVVGLFKQEFLISELRPPLTISNPFEYLIEKVKKLSQVDKVEDSLLNIQNKIEAYDHLPVGEGTYYYIDLVRQMKKLNDVKNTLQVDMAISAEQAELNTMVGEEVAKAAECLFKLSTHDKDQTPLSQYRKEFLERYGYAREVPVLELLDEEVGIGAPATYKYPNSTRNDNPRYATKERDELLMKLIQESILEGNKEIVLDDETVSQLAINEVITEYLPDSIELYTEIIASSPEAIDNGDFRVVLGSILGSNGIGKTFGRFLDFMGEDTKSSIKQVYGEQEQKPSTAYAEISYLPRYGRSANVALIDGLREYEISLGTNSSSNATKLPLNDIVVGATRNRFYLKSLTLDQEIKVSTGHMLNSNTFPNVYRFMREVSVEREHQFEPFNWGMTKLSTYLPRLRYRKTILSPAQWYIKPEDISLEQGENFYQCFRTWAKKWTLPRYVYMIIFDNKILLDTQKEEHVEEIIHNLKQNQTVQLNESIGGSEDRWVVGPEGQHVMECVFPLVSQKRNTANPDPIPDRLFEVEDLKEERYRKIGSDWLYYNIYIGENSQNDFILKELYPFAEDLIAEGLCDQWFYMRYKDPHDHLRIRFHGDPQTLILQVIPRVIEWEKRSNNGVIQRMTIDSYIREVERYGGPNLISLAEEIFYRDSQTSYGLLRSLRFKGTTIPVYVLVSLSLIHLMKELGWNFQEQLEYLSSVTNKHDYKKEFREWKNTYNRWLSKEDFISLIEEEGESELSTLFDLRSQALNTFKYHLDEQSYKGSLWSTKPEIINSLIHIHCNRVGGIDRELEVKSVTFARHALESIIQYLKHVKPKEGVMS